MFLEQKILRPAHWTTILGEKSNTTCHQKQTMFTNKEMWFLLLFPEKFFQDTYCVDLHSRRKIMRVLSLNFLMSSFYVIFLTTTRYLLWEQLKISFRNCFPDFQKWDFITIFLFICNISIVRCTVVPVNALDKIYEDMSQTCTTIL